MSAAVPAPPANPPREWAPRIWQGCDLFAWLRLLARNRFAVGLPYLYIAVIVTLASFFNALMRLLQEALLGDRPARTPLRQAPLFIVGHWRTGTTLLHELLILDPRHAFPTTYQCLCPAHFLLSERWLPRLLWFLVPSRRPMDNMPAGWDRPQEDEFALCLLGQPSPYLTIAFPNHPPQDQDAFDVEGMPPRARRRWREAFVALLRKLSWRDGRRLVLKSPTHSCRLPTLLELFPDARFVHIVRDPHVVFASTVNLWRTLYETHGLQKPTGAGLEEYVFGTFAHLYKRIEEGRQLVPPGRFHEMRYEDLVREPVGEMRRLYEALGLGGFEEVRPRIEAFFAANAGYQTNRYKPLEPALQAEITRRWGEVIRRYGYERPI
jgi:omega-hydroxy-beta-dihydromenaquinone-9 sulfotransferase